MPISSFPVSDFKGGWFAGDFTPTLLPSKAFEVSVKYYQAGASEARHVHKIATEFTVVTQGMVRMNGVDYGAGTIVLVPPGESTDFTALTDACTTVLKVPSVAGDKYLVAS